MFGDFDDGFFASESGATTLRVHSHATRVRAEIAASRKRYGSSRTARTGSGSAIVFRGNAPGLVNKKKVLDKFLKHD